MNVPKIEISNDYKKFNFASFNRSLVKSNIEKLKKEAIKEDNFPYFPIVVDKNLTIIDGQHRYKACMELNKPIYYIVKNQKAKPETVKSVNKAGAKHNLKNLFEIDLKCRNVEAHKINTVYKTYNELISINVVISIALGYGNGGSLRNIFEGGDYKCIDLEIVCNICESLLKLSDNKVVNVTMYNAIYYICRINNLDFNTFVNVLIERGFVLKRKQSKNNMMTKMVECYNYKKKAKNRITI